MIKIGGFEFRFERRRYGRKTFCWAEARIDGRWISLGDPWPGINWPRAELVRVAKTLQPRELDEWDIAIQTLDRSSVTDADNQGESGKGNVLTR